jgi:hypothetical protein
MVSRGRRRAGGGGAILRQPHPEINFRRGRALNRTSAGDLLATMRWLGMSDDEIRAALTRPDEVEKEAS